MVVNGGAALVLFLFLFNHPPSSDKGSQQVF